MSQEVKSRRRFIKLTAAGAVGGALSQNAASYAGILGSNDRIRVGVVGFSERAMEALIPALHAISAEKNCEIVAVADIWNRRRDEGADFIGKLTGKTIARARNNDELARRVTKAAARRDAATIRSAVKREPAATDLYVAHVYGVGTAISLIQAVVATPDAPLDRSFPEIAALPEVKQGAGAPITVVQFYRRLGVAMAEPPRLVAIGLNPAAAATTGAETAARDSLVAWQTKVDVARASSRTQ